MKLYLPMGLSRTIHFLNLLNACFIDDELLTDRPSLLATSRSVSPLKPLPLTLPPCRGVSNERVSWINKDFSASLESPVIRQ